MADGPVDRNQAEPRDISSALDVEQLELNLYRSRSLSLNFDARGVFGGQVVSQALVAATNCVKPEFTLHVRVLHSPRTHAEKTVYCASNSPCMYVHPNPSQCSNDAADPKAYFLHGASASTPLLYYVDRVRDGRSYATRSVRAVQGGRNVFIMVCSFQIPEFWQPSRHWSMPQTPRPDECDTEVEHLRRMAAHPDTPEERRAELIAYAEVRYFTTLLTVRPWVVEH